MYKLHSKKTNWKKEVMPAIKERLELFNSQGIIPTLRTIFYALVSLNIIPNTQNQYQYLNKFISNAILKGELSIDCFADQNRIKIGDFNDEFIDARQYIKDVIGYLEDIPKTYPLTIPKWHNQPHYVEIWIEKDSLSGTFQSVLKDRNVRIVSNKGSSCVNFIHENINRLKSYSDKGKEIHIRYFGELDPFGENIEEWIYERFQIFDLDVDFKRIAINEEQMRRFHLPENPNPEIIRKLNKDPKRDSFIRKYGRLFQIELDALQAYAPDEFKQMILESVDNFFDQQIYDNLLKKYSNRYLRGILKEDVRFLLNRLN